MSNQIRAIRLNRQPIRILLGGLLLFGAILASFRYNIIDLPSRVEILSQPTSAPSNTPYDHYSLLRTIEEAWRLPLLGNAACDCTAPMADFFMQTAASHD